MLFSSLSFVPLYNFLYFSTFSALNF
jgi:hypothetical protein